MPVNSFAVSILLFSNSGKTLVVLKGSGRASDILCYGFEHSIEVEREVDGYVMWTNVKNR